jgi:SAM-dependent methyltransferase
MNLSPVTVIERHFGKVFSRKRAFEMSTYGATHDFLSKNFLHPTFSEYFPGKPLGVFVDGVRNEDATNLTFADESFDLVTSNQVFEHVEEDIHAYRECYRVLAPGGALIFTVPLYDTAVTEQLARSTESGELEWLQTPEYHDSRSGGPMSAPVFWRHSKHDIVGRVRRGGFQSVMIEEVRFVEGQEVAQPVVYARK